ncbi:MAG TPA: DNA alkylation repair protein, partial [Kiritimatiellia bacterium]|nr:DNA alkylation repair protein [Kiritimatiellia bacterium]
MAARGASPAVIPTVRNILRDLAQQKNPAQAKHLRRFFRTGPGEYGAGDQFWGLKVPQTRAILGRYGPIPLPVAAE